MIRIEARIKTPFGEIVVEGETPQEILDLLNMFPKDFTERVTDLVSNRVVPSGAQLKGLIESTTEGPVIIAHDGLTHYEAIGLTMYASEEKKTTAAKIAKLLESSGLKVTVPARINEMTKRGHIFKQDPNRPEFKLTIQGERWIENEILPKLRGKAS